MVVDMNQVTLHQPSLSLSHMGEQTQTQTQTPSPSLSPPPSSATSSKVTTTTLVPTPTTPTTTNTIEPPPTITTTIITQPPPPTTTTTITTTTSKLPFRPRKVRKLATTTTTPTTTTPTKILVVPRIIPKTLSSDGEVAKAIRHLKSADPLLARIIEIHQPPVFDSFHPPFLALTKSILYQQLAFKAGTSIYTRFISLCGGESGVVPDAVLALSPHQLRQIGVSARKSSYLHDLANKYRNGILSDASIVEMDDKSLFTMLTMVKGIGSWSVHMFMIFSLHRPDVLPIGDLGVRKGVQLLYGLEELPRPSQMDQLCEKWRPYRSVASWYMWRFAEAKGTPALAGGAVEGGVNQQLQLPPPQPQLQLLAPPQHPQQQAQQQQQEQQSQQPQQQQLLDPITRIANLGACAWGH